MFLRLLLFVIVFTSAIALSTNGGTLTPNCLDETPAQRLKHSSAVFTGRVVKLAGSDETQIVTLSVIKSWKGVRSTELTLRNVVTPESVFFREGRNYLVFAYGNDSKLTTGACSAFELESAGRTVRSLNRMQARRRSPGD
jgi:hypothetical protein